MLHGTILLRQTIQKPQPASAAPPTTNTNSIPSSVPAASPIVPPLSVASLTAKQQPPVTTAPPPRKSSDKPTGVSPLPVQSVAPTTVPQAPKPVAVPTPSPDKPKPHIISPISTYTDPLEQSLANLEHDIKQNDPMDAMAASTMMPMPTTLSNPVISHPHPAINLNPNLGHPMLQPTSMGMDLKAPVTMSSMMPTNPLIHPGIHNSLEPDLQNMMQTHNNPHPNIIHSQNNGFGMKHDYEMGTNNNGISSMGLPMELSIPSMFDALPPHMNNQVIKTESSQMKMEDRVDPMNNLMNDKKLTMEQKSHSQSFSNFKPSKQEHNVKNASSWCSLAKGPSPQNTTPGGSSKQQVMDSCFKAFQNKAKEKADREKQRLENLELKRQQREQAEKERLRAENERRREREEEDALEKAR